MRICVCVDGSTNATKALRFTLENIIRPDRDELHLFLVVPRETLLEKLVDPFGMLTVSENTLKAHGDAQMAPYVEICKTEAPHISFIAHVVIADKELKVSLCEQAEARSIDLMIVGTRGMSAVERMVMGSVSEYCTSHAKCNVLVVRPDSVQ
eukprot:TRINITY_DN12860_c0_g1_i1.p1 TRINITY_DN12860_c0_g1~~TRINITY_DN12860_c0_g1_i1.p1  ORF type:complete len:164 (-),score=23.94 TRINITY_DN12860_c0_g1_i1:191-646(-)